MRPTVTAIAVLALAGQLSAQESVSTPGPGRKGETPSGVSGGTPTLPGETAPRPRNDPRARRQQDDWRSAHPGTVYRYCDDPAHRLVFATCLDAPSHADMQRMLAAQADQQAATLFDALPDSEIFVAVATPADIDRIFRDSPSTKGMYEHPLRRIVTADIGTALRHEWTHAMHFGHMERLGQPHMMWVQEGLASLYESYELGPDGTIRFLPTERHNEARRLAATSGALRLSQVVAMRPEEFMQKSQALYPLVRSVFEYMADQGKLRTWYRNYVQGFAEDRTGRQAIERTFGTPLDAFERSWRAWVLARPAVDLAAPKGSHAIGLAVKDAVDGVEVTQVTRGSAAQRAGIRAGDVIVAVDGVAVRSPREWTQATAGVRVPQLPVTVRRAGKRTELTIVFDRQADVSGAAGPSGSPLVPAGPNRAGSVAGLLDAARYESEG